LIRRVDRYELLEEVGSGGMAVVYRGRDTSLDREVAVKLLHPHLAARAESRARFSREARAVARLKHPNIVEIYDYAGDAAVESYLVTEFVHGRTLRAFADEERLELPEVGALLARALACALVHAHAAGVIHRDLKPENVLVLEQGGKRALKLVDFGIARILASDERMTMTGALVGSPNHMAPEIIEGREADARSDVFSLGTILFWLATGALPFAAPNPTATLRRVVEGERPDPREVSPLVSDALARVIAAALVTDPEQRLPTAAALRDALDEALEASGLADPEAELEAFLADPPRYKAELRPRLVAAALGAADAALGRGETARGMKLLDRVLALDPANDAVAVRLATLGRRARSRRLVARAAALAAAGALAATLGWAGASAWKARRARPAPTERSNDAKLSSAPPPASVPRPASPPAEREPGHAASSSARGSTSAPARGTVGAPSPSPGKGEGPSRRVAAAGAPAVVRVRVRPYAQRALLDGVEIAHGEQSVAFTLAPGVSHRIEIDHACCFPFVRDFPADDPVPQPLDLPVPLKPRPARLRVEGDPAARVLVDGRLLGTAGASQRSPLEIPIPTSGESPYEAPAELELQLEGRPPVRATLRLRAGADLTFAAPAEPSP
jgi:eukaryotic-like serine/threonine-protein kinase